MSSNFKKNKTLFLSLIGAGIVSLGLLVYVVIVLAQWSDARKRTEDARGKVEKLNNAKPAPGAENESRIQKDIELYEEKNKGLVDNFKSPLRPAVDAFLKELPPPRADMLTEEEIELYKVEGTGIEADGDTKAVPLKIRKLSYRDFRNLFMSRFEKYCEEHPDSTDTDEKKYSLNILQGFNDAFMQLFPQGKWNAALERFVIAASPLTYEVIDDSNRLPILLMACDMPIDRFGPRRVDGRKKILKEQVDRMVEMRIIPIADFDGSKNRSFFAPGSLNFIGGGSKQYGSSENNSSNSGAAEWKVADYPAVFFHWDVYGDIAKRLFNCGVFSLQEVILRTKAGDDSEDNRNASVDLNGSYEEDGNYRIYHYTIVFTCKMDVLRKVMANFDNAWKGEGSGYGRRMYIVRAASLYAVDNGAGRVMNPVSDDQKAQAQENKDEAAVRNRRRRRRQNEESAKKVEEKSEAVDFKPLYAVSEEEAKIRYYEVLHRLRDEERGVPQEEIRKRKEMSAEDKKKFYERYAARQLKPEERYGYATVLVGEHNDECEVYLDIDYVVLKQEQ